MRLQLLNHPLRFGFQKNPNNTYNVQTEALGCVAAFFLVQQNNVSANFQSQGNAFGFASIEVAA